MCVNNVTSRCRDDQQLLQWNLVSNETTKVVQFPSSLYPIDLQWLPKTAIQKTKVGAEVFLLTACDGKVEGDIIASPYEVNDK